MNSHFFQTKDFNAYLKSDGVRIYSIADNPAVTQLYSRTLFYKICLLSGRGFVCVDGHVVAFDGTVLLVHKPGAVSSWKFDACYEQSYVAVYTSEFFNVGCFRWVEQCALFSSFPGLAFHLTLQQSNFFSCVFRKLVAEQGVATRREVQNQISMLLHAMLQLTPAEKLTYMEGFPTGSSVLLMELAEMQFPPLTQVLYLN